MKPPQYVGCSGVMTPEQAHALLAAWPTDAPAQSLMIGVLTSQKVLAGGERNARSPAPEDIHTIWPTDPRALNLIHYFTKDPSTLGEQLLRVVGRASDLCDGVQINVTWPPVAQLVAFKTFAPSLTRVVLQIGPRALQDRSPLEIALLVGTYEGLITDVLIDMSAGQGKPINPAETRVIVSAIGSLCPLVRIGIAGGLCAEMLPTPIPFIVRGFSYSVDALGNPRTTVAQLVQEHRLSIDAEGRLRNDRDELDLDKARAYLAAAAPLVCGDGR